MPLNREMETQMDQDRRSVLKATGATALAAALPLAAGAQTRAGSGLKDLNKLDACERNGVSGIVALDDIELIPVLKLEPFRFAAEGRSSPPGIYQDMPE